jgi:hypothetical protein
MGVGNTLCRPSSLTRVAPDSCAIAIINKSFSPTPLVYLSSRILSEHFESLWEWFSSNVQNKEFVISKKAFKEVSDKIPECREWLQNSNIYLQEY